MLFLTTFHIASLTLKDIKWPQMTSNDLKTTSNETVKNKKNKLKGGAIEINEQYLDEINQKNNIRTLICVLIALYLYS